MLTYLHGVKEETRLNSQTIAKYKMPQMGPNGHIKHPWGSPSAKPLTSDTGKLPRIFPTLVFANTEHRFSGPGAVCSTGKHGSQISLHGQTGLTSPIAANTLKAGVLTALGTLLKADRSARVWSFQRVLLMARVPKLMMTVGSSCLLKQ